MKKPYFTSLATIVFFIVAMFLNPNKADAQSTLIAGDILFTGYDSSPGVGNAAAADRFSFVLLSNITSNTTIYFTDRGYFTSTWQGGGTTEGVLKWTSGSPLTTGTEVYIMGFTAKVNGIENGTVTVTNGNAVSGLNLSTAGDQLIAFQNQTGDPTSGATFIAGLHWGICTSATDASWDGSTCTGPANSTMPGGLSSSSSAIWMGNPGTGGANTQGSFNGTGSPFASIAALRAALLNKANWTKSTNPTVTEVTVPPNNIQLGSVPTITSNPLNKSVCAGGTTTFSISATGATSYQWQENAGSGFSNITNGGVYSTATTATLTLTAVTVNMTGRSYRCIATGTGSATSNAGVLTVSSMLTSGSQNNITCFGGATGTATVSVSGGIGNYSYSWSPGGGNTATVTGLSAQTYTVTVTDGIGCTTTRGFNISQPSAIVATGVQTNVSCFGGNNGSATVSATGGTGSYTYTWVPAVGTGATVNGLSAGSYTVTIKDANLCSTAYTFTISAPSAISLASWSQTNVACNGGNTGVASVSPSGGTGAYNYTWSPAVGNGPTVTGLSAGTYSITVRDANNCSATRNFTIAQPAIISSTGSQTNVSCFGGNNGTATVNATGGAGGFTYSWSPSGGNQATATGLSVGNYTVTITDANSCTATRSYTISGQSSITTTGSQINVNCFGGSNGSVTVSPSGGAGGYTYSWSPVVGNGPTVTGLAAGTYSVTVTDANSCTATRSFTIIQPTQITLTGSQTDVNCNGGVNGSATVVATGGAGNYTYSWSPYGGNGATATGLSAQNYTVMVTDGNGCTATRNFTIGTPAAISTSGSQTNISCFGGSNGSATVNASGGAGNYLYSWSPYGGNSATATGLNAQTFTVTVTDANGCTSSRSFTILQPNGLTITNSQSNVSCNGGSNGTISASVSGGSGTYTYDWSPGNPSGDGTASISGLTAHTYTLTVIDANGCSVQKNITISQPSAIIASGSQTNVSCNSENDGTATVAVTGGSGIYSYAWFPSGGNAAAATNLAPGSYICFIFDTNGCSASKSFVITEGGITTWNGTIWSNGAPNSSLKAIFNADFTSTGDLTACGVQVNGSSVVTVTSGHDFNVLNKVVVGVSANLILQNNANLIQTANVVNSGSIKVTREAKMRRQEYTYWGSPVSGQTLQLFSPFTLPNRIYSFDEAANAFVVVPSPSNTNFVAGRGVMFRAPNTFLDAPAAPQVFTGYFTGIPNNGTYTMPMTVNSTGYNFLSNPYPSPINADLFLGVNPGTLYFWTHTSLTGPANSNYATYNKVGGTTVATSAPNGSEVPNGFIQTGQGFLFKTLSASSATFNNGMRAGNNDGQFFRNAAEVKSRFWLNLQNSEDVVLSQALVGYVPNATDGVDEGIDGALREVADGSSIATMIDGDNYTIQGRPEFDLQETVPVALNLQSGGQFKVALDHFDGLFETQDIFLNDSLTGITHNLKGAPYLFTAAAGVNSERFKIVYQNTQLNVNPVADGGNTLIIYSEGERLAINAGLQIISKVKVFDIRGRLIYEKDAVGRETTVLTTFDKTNQVLLLQVHISDNRIVTKKVVF